MALPQPSPWPFVGMGGLACLFFLYAAAGTFWPWWLVVALLAFWVVLVVIGLRWFTPRPRATVLLPVLGVLVYAACLGLDVWAIGG